MPIAAIKGRALLIALPPPFGPYRLLIAELGQSGNFCYQACYPARAARSVTVYAKDATTADGLDDAILIMGVTRGLALIESIPDAGAIIVDAHNKVHISSRLRALVKIVHPPTDGL
jgi:hypothetical protein